MGYDGILFGRLDYQEKDQRTAEKTLQMIWKVNENARKTKPDVLLIKKVFFFLV